MATNARAITVGATSGTFKEIEGTARPATMRNYVQSHLGSMRTQRAIFLMSFALVSAGAGYLLQVAPDDRGPFARRDLGQPARERAPVAEHGPPVDGHWYLVPMLGERCNWVQNVRAANGRRRLPTGVPGDARWRRPGRPDTWRAVP